MSGFAVILGSRAIRVRLLETTGGGGKTEAFCERAGRSGGATEVPAAASLVSTL